jgi:anti-sigma regulatory factor (Ser/Thr protein kinase)
MPHTQLLATKPLPFFFNHENADNRSHYFFTSDEINSFQDLLTKPYQHFVEMREYVHLSQVLSFVRSEHPHISLSLTTETAFKQPVADFFTAHIARKRAIAAETMSDIKTCLQEAVMNAIIHGNLIIEHSGDEIDGFQHYLDQIALRIEDELLGLKRVSVFAWFTDVSITICVSDQGKGFELEQPAIDETKPYGRGLALIRCLASRVWQTKPNNIYMQFPLHA